MTGDLRSMKREVFIDILERLQSLTVLDQPVMFRRRVDALWLDVPLPDGALGCICLATIKDGLPAGQFAIDPAVLVYSGPVMTLLRNLPLRSWAYPPSDTLLASHAATADNARAVYAIRSTTSPNIAKVCRALRDGCLPRIASFGTRSIAALDHTLARPAEVAAPFSTAVVLALANRLDDRIAGIIETATANPAFWDAAYVDDIDAHVQVIRQLVEMTPELRRPPA